MRPVRLLTYSLCLSALWIPLTALAAEDEEFDPVHHTADAYYLDFLPIGKVELPRILILRSESTGYYVRVYRTTKSALRSGEMEAKIETKEDTTTVTRQDSLQALIAEGKHLDAKLSPVGGSAIILDLSVTKHLVFALLASGILLAIFVQLGNRYKRGIGRTSAPRGLVQNLFET